MNAYAYAIWPTRGDSDDNPAITAMMEAAWLAAHGESLAPTPAPVIGWIRVLLRDGEAVDRR